MEVVEEAVTEKTEVGKASDVTTGLVGRLGRDALAPPPSEVSSEADAAAVAPWCVVHCRPRCEKKVAAFCEKEGIYHLLPLYRSVKSYRGKKVVFQKPLFPNYVFLRLDRSKRGLARQNRYVANLLDPPDQAEFEHQLSDILRALESEHEVRLAPLIVEGRTVKILTGALRGMEGVVVRREGVTEVVLRLDFIAQAAAVRVSADELEPV